MNFFVFVIFSLSPRSLLFLPPLSLSLSLLFSHSCISLTHSYFLTLSLLLDKPPLAHKTQKNNGFRVDRRAPAFKISLFTAYLHNYGRADISLKQLKKTKQVKRMYATFRKSQKNT